MRRSASAFGGAVLTMAVVLASAVLASAQPAASADPTIPKWMYCDSGTAVTANLTGLSNTGRAQLYISPCHPPEDTSTYTEVYAIGEYRTGGATSWRTKYPATAANVEATTYLFRDGASGYTQAVCLIQNEKFRLDCIEINWMVQPDGSRVPVAGAHIPVDSPLVNKPANPVLGDWDGPVYPDPGCLTCGEEDPND